MNTYVVRAAVAAGALAVSTVALAQDKVFDFFDEGPNCSTAPATCPGDAAGTLTVSFDTVDSLLFTYMNTLGAGTSSPDGRLTGLRFDFVPDQDYFPILSITNQVGDAPDQNAEAGFLGPDPFGSNYSVSFVNAAGEPPASDNEGIQPGNTDSFILTGFTSDQTSDIHALIDNVGAFYQTMGEDGEGSAFLIGVQRPVSPNGNEEPA
jgi:hypothetical protein